MSIDNFVVICHHLTFKVTQAFPHEDFSVWNGDRIIAQGGREMTLRIFKEKTMTTPTPTPAINIEKRIEQYVALRDKIKELNDAHKAALKPYNEMLDKLNDVLLSHLNTVGVDSAKTGAGTVYKTLKESCTVEDPDQFMRFVIGGEHWDLMERKASLTACRTFAEENASLPPGVRINSVQVVGVRRG